jgi:tRNA(Ile)-lysidine synthase
MTAIDLPALPEQFSIALDRLGPFEPRLRLAIAVSGGADSMALALLTSGWASRRRGELLALTVDHGLRARSSAEADLTLRRLTELGIPGRKLVVGGLARGPALARRARDARYRLLLDACAELGIAHLLLGHHRGDQVETVMMRALSSSTARGLAGMPALTETRFARLLRPLLDIAPEQLRALLTARGVAWVEDPSNRDRGALRTRLREARGDPGGTGEGTRAVADAAREAGARRARLDHAVADVLARRATIRPEGYAVLSPGPIEPEALAALLRCVAGTDYTPPIDRVAALARDLRPATLGGVRITRTGRAGIGWLLIRERRAMAGPVAARRGVTWDGRFRLIGTPPDGSAAGAPTPDRVPPTEGAGEVTCGGQWKSLAGGRPERILAEPSGAADPGDRTEDLAPDSIPDTSDLAGLPTAERLTLGALGADAFRFRNRVGPSALILEGLPALRCDGMLLAVPHVGMGDKRWRVVFDPRNPAAGAPFGFG